MIYEREADPRPEGKGVDPVRSLGITTEGRGTCV